MRRGRPARRNRRRRWRASRLAAATATLPVPRRRSRCPRPPRRAAPAPPASGRLCRVFALTVTAANRTDAGSFPPRSCQQRRKGRRLRAASGAAMTGLPVLPHHARPAVQRLRLQRLPASRKLQRLVGLRRLRRSWSKPVRHVQKRRADRRRCSQDPQLAHPAKGETDGRNVRAGYGAVLPPPPCRSPIGQGLRVACRDGVAANLVSIHWAFAVCAAVIRSKWPLPDICGRRASRRRRAGSARCSRCCVGSRWGRRLPPMSQGWPSWAAACWWCVAASRRSAMPCSMPWASTSRSGLAAKSPVTPKVTTPQ